MYKYNKGVKSTIKSVKVTEGESIEEKVFRMVHNKEAITDGAPEIFTERKDGVLAGYNIRTDRFEVAAEAMDTISRSIQAKRENVGKLPKSEAKSEAKGEAKGETKEDSVTESTQGKSEQYACVLIYQVKDNALKSAKKN